VVARVNGQPILRRDFDMAVQLAFRQRGRGERRHEDLQAARDAVLESLIDNELLYQKAVQAKTTVSESDVRADVERLKKGLGTPEDVAAFLKTNGVTEKDLVEQVRHSLVVRKFVDAELGVPRQPGDAEARAYYDAHGDQFGRPEAVHISQILVGVSADDPPARRAEARSKAEAIMKELRGGQDFAEMARRHSDAAEAQKGGDSGWVWLGGGALPPVERAALALRPGQLSDIVESRRGFHIIKAIERRPAGAVPFEEARGPIVERLAADARRDQLRAYAASLRKSARIETTP
jgi:peptidyl-prolyl cis-trans isomerase C